MATRTSTYRNVSITLEDAEYYESIIQKWADINKGVKLTLPRIINLAMRTLEEQLND